MRDYPWLLLLPPWHRTPIQFLNIGFVKIFVKKPAKSIRVQGQGAKYFPSRRLHGSPTPDSTHRRYFMSLADLILRENSAPSSWKDGQAKFPLVLVKLQMISLERMKADPIWQELVALMLWGLPLLNLLLHDPCLSLLCWGSPAVLWSIIKVYSNAIHYSNNYPDQGELSLVLDRDSPQ